MAHTIRDAVLLAGILHFCQVPAMAMYPKMLGWKEDLTKLTQINRRIVMVISLAIMIAVIGLGVVVICTADELVSHTRLAVALTGFLTVFWGYRALVQYLVYMRIWVKGWLGIATNYGLAALFTYLTVAYGAAFIFNLRG